MIVLTNNYKDDSCRAPSAKQEVLAYEKLQQKKDNYI